MRRIWIPLVLALSACGGGDSPALRSVALDGLVYQVDGQTVDRSGVMVRVVETGDSMVTGPQGLFFFPDVRAGSVTLQLGSSLVAVTHDEGEGMESEEGDDDCDEIEVRVAIEDGEVVELSILCADRARAEADLVRAEGSPDADVEGEVEVESRAEGDEFEIEVENLAPGTGVEFFLDDPDTAEGFLSIGSATANSLGEAELEFDEGEALPLGAAGVGDLAGFGVEVRLAGTGELLLTGEVPDLPDGVSDPGDDPLPGDDARGRAELVAHVDGVQGHVEIRVEDDGEQRFKLEAEHLTPGTEVLFLIEDEGAFVEIGSAIADLEGEAEIDTNDTLPLPLGVGGVAELVGRGVRVELAADGTLLLSGEVPPLVAD
ncbi:MAG: hypothetical protein ACREID_03755 [Planctomycetota bacterium]